MTAGGTRETFRNRKQKEMQAFQTISTFFTLTAVYLFAPFNFPSYVHYERLFILL